MIEPIAPSVWSLQCPECEGPASLTFPPDIEPGAGIGRCDASHEFLFQYDGLSVRVFDAASDGRLG